MVGATMTSEDDSRQWSVKYRPTSIDDYITTDRIRSQFKSVVAGNAQSVLLTGTTGTGKTTLAFLLAHAITKTEYGSRTPDIIDKNVGENSGKDDMKAIIASARFLPLKAPKKVFIMDEAHLLTGAAASALLKPLEAPQSHVVWVLCTDQPEKLLPTLVNRCLPFTLDMPDPEEMRKMLLRVLKSERVMQKHDVKDRIALCKAVVMASGGIPRAALQLLQTAVASLGDYKNVAELIRGPVLKTPALEVNKAAMKALLAMTKAYSKPSAMKAAITTLRDVDPTALLNCLIWMAELAAYESVTGEQQAPIYQFRKAAKDYDIELDPAPLGMIFSTLVEAKQKVGNFSVSPGGLLFKSMLDLQRRFEAEAARRERRR